MFLNAHQIVTLQNIVKDNNKARCDAARLHSVICTMLPRDIARDGNITITDNSVTISVKGSKKDKQIISLKIAT